ncbi:SDR family NAD(P)-dependent oxidoreductase [Kribbella sp. NPDC006257]|uniref:SDR family NAD(P)-dependent oxidoreductase n=1 Tax=Kribbella sp. NPDC006257 TaxID=3156738 RepID=UPI0033B731DA
MTTTLITGANKSLGYETARQLIAAGHTVYVGARDLGRGREAADRLGGRFVQLDVTDDASVRAAAQQILEEAGGLDVLVNNAGILGSRENTVEDFQNVYATNVFGVARMMQEFLPLLEKSDNPVVVNVSSGLGSITVATDPEGNKSAAPVWVPALVYGSSKAALNMLTVQYAHQYPNMRINVVDPGYTATDFNSHNGYQTIEQGAEIIIRLAQIDQDGPTAQYLSLTGTMPW